MNKKVIQEVKYNGIEQRLDLAVSESFGFTRSKAQKLIRENNLLLNGNIGKAKDIIKAGDSLEVLSEEEKVLLIPEIIYEDTEILVIDKPSGISVHPSSGEKDKTVVEIFRNKLDFPKGDERAGVVHRLDKGTSGVMVLAKTSEALSILQKEFKNRNVKKTYIALIHGIIQPSSGVINMPIKRDVTKKERMTVSKDGKESVTEFNTIKQFNHKYSLLELKPKTGRTHQIRVHLSVLGYPIVGDFKYGAKENIPLSRIFLHAKRLEFRHPKTEKLVSYAANPPEELEDFLTSL